MDFVETPFSRLFVTNKLIFKNCNHYDETNVIKILHFFATIASRFYLINTSQQHIKLIKNAKLFSLSEGW